MKKVVFGALAALLVLLSCEPDTCFHSTGKNINTILVSDSFDVVAVHGAFDVELVQDTAYFVEASGGDKVIDNVEAIISRDTLLLYNNNACFWARDYKRPLLRVHFKLLTRIDVFETSYIFSHDSITDDLYFTVQTMMAEADITVNNHEVYTYVHHTTGGKYVFRGKTDKLVIYGFYSALYDASELEAVNATIFNHSSVDYKVWATENLNVEIFNRGNVLYKGNPEVHIDSLTSTGNVFRLE